MYLDNAATTPLYPEVKDYIISLLDTYQNPSSLYQSGINVKQIIKIYHKEDNNTMPDENMQPYIISNEYNITEILAHFDSDYVISTIEDKLEEILENYAITKRILGGKIIPKTT